MSIWLLALGFSLWYAKVTTPGASVIIPGVQPSSSAFGKDGAMKVTDLVNGHVWRVTPYGASLRGML